MALNRPGQIVHHVLIDMIRNAVRLERVQKTVEGRKRHICRGFLGSFKVCTVFSHVRLQAKCVLPKWNNQVLPEWTVNVNKLHQEF